MNINLIQPLRTNILHIRSKETAEIDNLNTNFSVTLKNAIAVNENEIVHVTLTSLELPYSFYNISSALNNNVLVYENSIGVKTTLTLLSQDYSITQLVTYLNADTGFSAVFTTSYNKQRMKITFINKDIEARFIYFSESNINKLIGWEDTQIDIDIPVDLVGIESSGVINMASVHSLFIRSNLSTGNIQSSRNGNSTILQKVSVDRNSGGIIYFNQNDQQQVSVLNPQVISTIEIRITDQNDNTIDLNNVNYEMSFLFEIFEAPKQIPNVKNMIVPNGRNNRNNTRTGQNNIIQEENTELETEIEEPEKTDKRLVLDELLEKMSNN
tara:strand:- start:288 stop:1265 length:978 start_codon:yes stop_codon:yes gene_type:complete